MRAVIFANGELLEPESVAAALRADDYIIAVNGGTHHALALDAVPALVIGDLDSLESAEQARLRAAGTQIRGFSPRKDETDLELALRHAVDQQASDILIVAAWGGRLDQSLANLFLLMLPMLQGINAEIIEGRQRIFLIRDHARISGQPGDTVSILPVGGPAVGVSNSGLEWPLHEAILPVGTPRGVSNVLLESSAHIWVNEGMLICIVTSCSSAPLTSASMPDQQFGS